MEEKKGPVYWFMYVFFLTIMVGPQVLWFLSMGVLLTVNFVWGPEAADEVRRTVRGYFQ